MKGKLRIGIIGAGGIANSVHLPSLTGMENIELIWICDLIAKRAQAAATQWNIPTWGISYQELLAREKPDAVFILVQPDMCFRPVIDCLRADCHVFTEKPLGVTVFQAETIARVAKERKLQCQVGMNRRFIPLVQEVLQRMQKLAPIHQVDGWFYKNSGADFYDGGLSAFTGDAIHTVDLVRYIAGAEAETCAQISARYGDSQVDNAWNAVIAFQNGVTGTVHSNYATGGRVHGFAIHNALASAYINVGFGGQACSAKILHHVQGTFSISSGGAGEQYIEELDGKEIAGSEAYYAYYGYETEDRAFVAALLEEKEVSCSAKDLVGTMRLLEKLQYAEVSAHAQRKEELP